MTKIHNKWVNGAIPALFIHCSIGSVYAWSLFIGPISQHLNCSQTQIQFAFSLAIFFLGMSAAFGGRLVEKNVKRSTLISCICFCGGLLITALAIQFKSLIGIYLGYGCIMGVGLGIGYLTPVKALMMWFQNNKGLGTGISITGFGFASAIASPMITGFLSSFGLATTFILLSVIYLIPMIVAMFLLKKPVEDVQTDNTSFRYGGILKNKTFIEIWLIMFINISCGLALISTASPMLQEFHINLTTISLVVAIMGLFNGVGRLIISALSDKCNNRAWVYVLMLAGAIIITLLAYVFINPGLTILCLLAISAIYGAGFSCLPTLLSDVFGMKNISKIHGLCLTSWAMAGLVGNQISAYIKVAVGEYRLTFLVICVLYALAMLLAIRVKTHLRKQL